MSGQNGIKRLMSKYGYSALVVYIGVTVVSLPSCYFIVDSVGEEKISIVLNRGKRVFGYGEESDDIVRKRVEGRRVERLELRSKYMGELKEQEASYEMSIGEKLRLKWDLLKTSPILTELVLAYGLHKSLIFVRIPLTAAITPAIARVLPARLVNRAVKTAASKTLHTAKSSLNTVRNNNTLNNNTVNNTYPKQAKTGLQKWFNGLF
ncbi:putative N-terminal acetyltransferase 2 [Monosporozyma servazzii]